MHHILSVSATLSHNLRDGAGRTFTREEINITTTLFMNIMQSDMLRSLLSECCPALRRQMHSKLFPELHSGIIIWWWLHSLNPSPHFPRFAERLRCGCGCPLFHPTHLHPYHVIIPPKTYPWNLLTPLHRHQHYVMVPKTGLWRQILGPYSSYEAFVWQTW